MTSNGMMRIVTSRSHTAARFAKMTPSTCRLWRRVQMLGAATTQMGPSPQPAVSVGGAVRFQARAPCGRLACCRRARDVARRGGRARLKASDSKSDRGPEGPSGVQILSPPPIFPDRRRSVGEPETRRGDRAAEGAALEMPCTGNPCAAGSNPAPSARIQDVAVLDGELAVPCDPQSASAGLNSHSEGGPC